MAEIIDDLFEEVVQQEQEQVTPQPEVEEVPEKFKGKSAKEIADSYVNLEKELGRKAQEVGELRQLTDQILRQQISDKQTAKPIEVAPEEEVDFFVDPKAAVQRAVENHPKIKAFEQQAIIQQQNAYVQQAKAAEKAFKEKHSDFNEILQEKDFQDWVGASPVRQRLFQQANANYDFYAGDELFSTYKELRKVKQAQGQKQADEAKAELKAATVPSGSSSSEQTTKVYRRADLIRLKMTDPARYDAMSDEILKAYAEGRVK